MKLAISAMKISAPEKFQTPKLKIRICSGVGKTLRHAPGNEGYIFHQRRDVCSITNVPHMFQNSKALRPMCVI